MIYTNTLVKSEHSRRDTKAEPTSLFSHGGEWRWNSSPKRSRSLRLGEDSTTTEQKTHHVVTDYCTTTKRGRRICVSQLIFLLIKTQKTSGRRTCRRILGTYTACIRSCYDCTLTCELFDSPAGLLFFGFANSVCMEHLGNGANGWERNLFFIFVC